MNRQWVRVDRSSMHIQIRPFDGFVVIEISEAFSCKFPNKEGDDANYGNTAGHRHADNGTYAEATTIRITPTRLGRRSRGR
jgi:hypothetical protein